MLYCPLCRNLNDDDAQVCQYCETSLTRYCDDGTLAGDTILKSRYKIIETIKAGGMGVVYRGEDIQEKAIVAIKQLFVDEGNEEADEILLARFEREASLLSNLDHSNLPKVSDYFEDNSDYFMIMDFIDGIDLEWMLEKDGNPGLPEEKVIEWAAQICDVLDYLHNHKPMILYRDIKPSNIIIRKSDEKAILIDFGVAKPLEGGLTSGKTTIGTVGYSPPEQYKGKQKPQSDIYALGATLHHILTGKFPEVPFYFDPINTLNPKISGIMEELIMKALEFEIENRFTSAANMKKALLYVKEYRYTPEPVKKSQGKTLADLLNDKPEKKTEFKKTRSAELAKAHSNIGVMYAKEGLYEQAKDELKKAVELDDEEAEVYGNLGYIYLQLENYKSALEYLNKAVSLNQNLPGVYCNLGVIYNRIGKPEKALLAFRKALQLDPDSVEAHINLAYIYGTKNKFREMVEECEKAMKIKPDYMEAYINFAYGCNRLKEHEKGIRKLSKAVLFNPKNAIALSSLGVLYGEIKDYNKSVEALNKAIELDENFAEAYSNLGVVYYKRGNVNASKESFKKAIKLNPWLKQAKANLSFLCREKGIEPSEQEEIIGLLSYMPGEKVIPDNEMEFLTSPAKPEIEEDEKKLFTFQDKNNNPEHMIEEKINQNPRDPSLYVELGDYYNENNMIDEAIKQYQQAIRIDQSCIDAHFNLGMSYMKKKPGILAENEFKKVVKLEENHFSSHMNLGILSFARGDFEGALDEYTKALNICEDNPEVNFKIGIVHKEMGNHKKAITSFENVLKKDPSHADAYYNLGFIHYDIKGDYDRAEEYLKQAISKNLNYPNAHLYLGNIYYKKDMFREAMEQYLEVISLNQDYAIAYSNLGATYNNLELLDKAQECYLKAIEIDPNVAETHLNLGVLYQKRKDYENAIEEMDKYLELTDSKDTKDVKKKISEMKYILKERSMRSNA